MGTLTYSQFQDHLKLELGNRTALESPTNWYGSLINQAYSMVCTRTRIFNIPFRVWLPELETSSNLSTADGTAYVAKPSDLLICRGIWDSTNDRMLKWITPEDYYRRVGRANTSSEGYPNEYTRLGTYFYFYPTPGGTYTEVCYYKKKPTALSGNSDATILGSEWDQPIVKLAAIIGMYKLKEYDFAEIEKKNFQEDIAGLINIYHQEQRQMDKHLQPNMLYLRRGMNS